MTDITIDLVGPGARTALEAANRAEAAAASVGIGPDNVGVGQDSIPEAATGIGNTAVGNLALGDLTTGNSNTALGDQALRDNTTGGNNTAIGAAAGRANAAASGNTLVGSSASLAATSGGDNVFIGFGAHSGALSGSSNVGIGRDALAAYAGNESVAVGYAALSATTGIRNTAVGSSAGLAVTSGEYNTFLGYNAGGGGTQSGSVSNSIALGFNAMTTRENQITLGNDGSDELRLFDFTMFRKAGLGGQAIFLGNAGNYTATGGANIAIGITAGFSLANADSNTLIGYETGYNITSGGNNVAIGARALLSATTAGDCTAIGAGALNQMVTGVGTTAVGRYSMQCVEEGGNNTAIGDASGRNLHGEQNCLMGYGVMRWGYANSYNVVIGQGALYNAGKASGTQPEDGGDPGALTRTSGVVTGPHSPSNFNAVVGHLAFELTTGGGHTGLGANAGRTLTGGSDMICIGRDAGFGVGQKVDATGAIVIGVGAVSTRNNEIVIGKSADTHITIAGVEFTKAQLVALKALVS